jgi:3-oxoacyl-[acyl-carrier-protein] synthase II
MKTAVVVGSGMGGLTAARLLQQAGYRVTVCEQHTRPGGMLHRFFREGVAYDTGFHYCGSIAAGQPLGQILRHLGVFDELEFHALDPAGFDRLRFPDLEVPVPVGWDAYADALCEVFPHEHQGIRSFLAELRAAVGAYGLYRLEPTLDLERLMEVEGRPLLDAIRAHVRDPRVAAVLCGQSVLYGVPPDEAALGVHALILDHFLQGAYTVRGGGDKLAMALTRRIRRDGGEVRLRTEVTRIEVDDQRAVAVHLADGERLPADVVVSNLHPRLTLELLPEAATRKAYRSRVADARVGHAHLGVYLELDGRVPELGNHNLYRHTSWEAAYAYRSIAPGSCGLYFASAPSEHMPDPSGPGVVLMLSPLDWADRGAVGRNPARRPSAGVHRTQAAAARHRGRGAVRRPAHPGRTDHPRRGQHPAVDAALHAEPRRRHLRPPPQPRADGPVSPLSANPGSEPGARGARCVQPGRARHGPLGVLRRGRAARAGTAVGGCATGMTGMGTRRVVVTGIGMHTPLGDGREQVFDALLANRTGVVRMPEWAEIAELGTQVGAPVPDFDGREIPRKLRRTMGRVGLLAASAAGIAVREAGLPVDVLTSERTGVIVGSTAGSGSAEQEFWGHLQSTRSARGLKSTLFFQAMAHTCATNIALALGVQGELFATNSACASSSQAIGLAAQRIRLGMCDAVLAGGAEELHVSAAVIFGSLSAATTGFNHDPDLTPRPFDRRRDGIVVGEGAAIFVLEEREMAIARGAPILAEVLGFGTTCDAVHMASPDPEGMSKAIRRCLVDARRTPADVDYVNAHATGTVAGDASEAQALYGLFGDRVPVSSSKGHLGHTLGACGSIEAAICIEALRRGVLPGTRNLVDPDVAPIRLLRDPERAPIRHALNTNFAFGGVNSVLLFGHAEGPA